MAMRILAERKCPICGFVKPRNEFYLHAGKFTYAACRVCCREKRRKIYNDPLMGLNLRDKNKQWYAKHKNNAEYQAAAKVRKSEWAKRNPEKVKAAMARWFSVEENRNKAKKWIIAAKKANPEAILLQGHRRRARKSASGGVLSKGIVERLFMNQRGRCACCLAILKKTGHHLDHIVSLACGGQNIDKNVQLLCPHCNLQKHAKDPLDFMRSKGFLL